MNLSMQSYIPCLRWKLGEYQALIKLSTNVRRMIKPLIDVAEIGFDFEEQTDSKSIDEHLQNFAKKVKEKWGIEECYIDLHLIDPSERMANGTHPVKFVFDDLRLKGVQAVPVTGINQDPQWQDAIQNSVHQDDCGICFRISLEDALNPTLDNKITELLNKFSRKPEQCDLIIDEAAPNFEPIDGFVGFLETIIKKLPYLNTWRTFGLIGTSLPASLSSLGVGTFIIPRYEWQAYKKLIIHLKSSGIRIPTFGDYAINRPEVLKVDQRFLKTRANIRYSINDNWYILRGQKIRDFSECKDLCSTIVSSKFYFGTGFSAGDKYIIDCSQGNASTGNHPTWRWVGTNHHLTLVAQDVANLAVS